MDDELALYIDCVGLADEVSCASSDAVGETRTVENWQNGTMLVTLDLEDSAGSGTDRTATSGAYISSDLHTGADTAPPTPAPP